MLRRCVLLTLIMLLARPGSMGLAAQPATTPVVTPETYQSIATEVNGQRIFVLPQFELDVYEVSFSKTESRVCFDVYPGETWDEARAFLIEIDGASAAGWTHSTIQIDEAHGYAYQFVGPGMDAVPSELRIISADDPAGAATVRVRERPFTKNESAYFFRDEVAIEGVLDDLRGAEDVQVAALKYLPEGARLIDTYVSEQFASIDYRLGAVRTIVDYYDDGHIEKMVRENGERIFFASTLNPYTYSVNINDRLNLGGREELRPMRKGKSAACHTGGMAFDIEGYQIEENMLLIDWSAWARRSGLLVTLGAIEIECDYIIEEGSSEYGGLTPLQGFMRLGNAQDAVKAVQSISFVEGIPDQPFEVSMTLYAFEPLVEIEMWDAAPARHHTASLIDMEDGVIWTMSDVERDDDGSVGLWDELLDDEGIAGTTEQEYLSALEKVGYLKKVRRIQLSFTVEP